MRAVAERVRERAGPCVRAARAADSARCSGPSLIQTVRPRRSLHPTAALAARPRPRRRAGDVEIVARPRAAAHEAPDAVDGADESDVDHQRAGQAGQVAADQMQPVLRRQRGKAARNPSEVGQRQRRRQRH